ncbi:hypothetical protein ES703_87633 [subsurface metagenome]
MTIEHDGSMGFIPVRINISSENLLKRVVLDNRSMVLANFLNFVPGKVMNSSVSGPKGLVLIGIVINLNPIP